MESERQMSVTELIEKQLPKWMVEFRPQIREQLKYFAIELLETVNGESDREIYRPEQISDRLYKALEELRK